MFENLDIFKADKQALQTMDSRILDEYLESIVDDYSKNNYLSDFDKDNMFSDLKGRLNSYMNSSDENEWTNGYLNINSENFANNFPESIAQEQINTRMPELLSGTPFFSFNSQSYDQVENEQDFSIFNQSSSVGNDINNYVNSNKLESEHVFPNNTYNQNNGHLYKGSISMDVPATPEENAYKYDYDKGDYNKPEDEREGIPAWEYDEEKLAKLQEEVDEEINQQNDLLHSVGDIEEQGDWDNFLSDYTSRQESIKEKIEDINKVQYFSEQNSNEDINSFADNSIGFLSAGNENYLDKIKDRINYKNEFVQDIYSNSETAPFLKSAIKESAMENLDDLGKMGASAGRFGKFLSRIAPALQGIDLYDQIEREGPFQGPISWAASGLTGFGTGAITGFVSKNPYWAWGAGIAGAEAADAGVDWLFEKYRQQRKK
jgi:hypothetical protein